MIHEGLRSYRETLIGDRCHLLESYELSMRPGRSSESGVSALGPGSPS